MGNTFDNVSLPAKLSLTASRSSAGAARQVTIRSRDDVVLPVEVHVPITPELRAWLRANGHELTPRRSTDNGSATRGWTIRHRDDSDQPAPPTAHNRPGGGEAGPVASGFRSIVGDVDPDR